MCCAGNQQERRHDTWQENPSAICTEAEARAKSREEEAFELGLTWAAKLMIDVMRSAEIPSIDDA